MSAINAQSIFQSNATVRTSGLTEAEQIFRDAVQRVLSVPGSDQWKQDEIDAIASIKDAEELKQYLNDGRSTSLVWKHNTTSWPWKQTQAWLDTLGRFHDAISIKVQTNAAIATPIWGFISFITTIAQEISDTADLLNEFDNTLRRCLARFRTYIDNNGTKDPLRSSLVEFYATIIRFSLVASRIYKSSRMKMATSAVRRSVRAPFDKLLKDLKDLASNVDWDANAEIVSALKNQMVQTQWTPAVSASSQTTSTRRIRIPDLLTSSFTGRTDILQQIQQCFQKSNGTSPARTALWGPPGVGKSQIALRLASDGSVTPNAPQVYDYICFIRANSKRALIEEYRVMAHQLGLCSHKIDESEDILVAEKVRDFFSTKSRWLLVYDDVTDPAIVRQFTPIYGTGHILFTTRSQITAEALAHDQRGLEVRSFFIWDSVELVLKLQSIREPYPDRSKAIAEELAALVCGLPIAIEQTVKIAKLRGIPLRLLLPQLREKKTQILAGGYPTTLHEDNPSTVAVLALALEGVAEKSAEAVALFKLLVFLDTSHLPVEIITSGGPQLKDHFRRKLTYDRGLKSPGKTTKVPETQSRIPKHRWYEEYKPFELSSWRKMLHIDDFGRHDVQLHLLRIDSKSDVLLAKHFEDGKALQNVLLDNTCTEHALILLIDAGLIKRVNDKALWIHDLFADLTMGLVQAESSALYCNTAHLALTTVFLAFPIPEWPDEYLASLLKVLDEGADPMYVPYLTCVLFLPSAISIIKHCRKIPVQAHNNKWVGLFGDSTIGAELAHLVACTLEMHNNSKYEVVKGIGDSIDEAIHYYSLAVFGYQKAWQRMRDWPGVTERHITCLAKAEHQLVQSSSMRVILDRCVYGRERFGTIASVRCVCTLLKLGHVLQGRGDGQKPYENALTNLNMGVTFVEIIYGRDVEVTIWAMSMLSNFYAQQGDWQNAEEITRDRISRYQRGKGRNLVDSKLGADLAAELARYCKKQEKWGEAVRWLECSIVAAEFNSGNTCPQATKAMLRLAKVEVKNGRYERAGYLVSKSLRLREIDAKRFDTAYLVEEGRIAALKINAQLDVLPLKEELFKGRTQRNTQAEEARGQDEWSS